MDAPAGGEEEGGSKSTVFGEPPPASVSLNLTALMDILSNLLFFLLAAFGATIVMGINANVPVSSTDRSDIASTRQSVTANIALSQAGFDVVIFGSQPPDELDKWKRHIGAKANGELDYAGLTEHLLGIKQAYPRSDTVILTSEPSIKYEIMVNTMDAARESRVTVGGASRLVPVFPTVVISTVVK